MRFSNCSMPEASKTSTRHSRASCTRAISSIIETGKPTTSGFGGFARSSRQRSMPARSERNGPRVLETSRHPQEGPRGHTLLSPNSSDKDASPDSLWNPPIESPTITTAHPPGCSFFYSSCFTPFRSRATDNHEVPAAAGKHLEELFRAVPKNADCDYVHGDGKVRGRRRIPPNATAGRPDDN